MVGLTVPKRYRPAFNRRLGSARIITLTSELFPESSWCLLAALPSLDRWHFWPWPWCRPICSRRRKSPRPTTSARSAGHGGLQNWMERQPRSLQQQLRHGKYQRRKSSVESRQAEPAAAVAAGVEVGAVESAQADRRRRHLRAVAAGGGRAPTCGNSWHRCRHRKL